MIIPTIYPLLLSLSLSIADTDISVPTADISVFLAQYGQAIDDYPAQPCPPDCHRRKKRPVWLTQFFDSRSTYLPISITPHTPLLSLPHLPALQNGKDLW